MTFFDEAVVGPMGAWSRLSDLERQEGRWRLRPHLASGSWDERYGHLRHLGELDVGLRIVIAEIAAEG